jgi:hypothetical protein
MRFKLCLNCIELETGATRARLFPRGEVLCVYNIWLEKIGLVISVDQRHRTGIDKHSSLCLLYSCGSSRVGIDIRNL